MELTVADVKYNFTPREGDFLPRIDYFCTNCHKPFGKETIAFKQANTKICIANLTKEVKQYLFNVHGPLIETNSQQCDKVLEIYTAEIDSFLKFPTDSYEYRRFILDQDQNYIYFWTYHLAGYIDKSTWKACAFLCNEQTQKSAFLINELILGYFAWWSIFHGGLMMHGASIVRDQKAYIFFGPSGAGKTTISRLSEHLKIISDEYSMISKINSSYFVFRPPQKKSITRLDNWQEGFPLAGIYRLIQSNERFIEKIPKALMISEILANLLFAHAYNVLGLHAVANAAAILGTTENGMLHFKKDQFFWEVIP
ncbi:MAG: hypothetical protein A2Y62_17195 [Candidatus Fischerbacteria bacterium RBG_13_37_8]|uniref:Uncharacterized protein n=1 Tax=Candidatus Fischerbacteria bacterium RBG_13_37_8 TaxID=1817863 RepID=A0A1F5VG38_9BACT|nr:MAG: hypothetical protein A2Y62_17195 [Candidatus Fischerbacteria bacterium RBG_13_37_8]